MRKMLIAVAMLLIFVTTGVAWVPTLITYQGRLTSAAGTPVADASYSVVFSIYAAPSGGSAVWTETQNITTSGGLFTATLGYTAPLIDDIFAAQPRYLGVKVGADPEMTPRTMLTSINGAFRVSSIDSAQGGDILGNLSLQGSTALAGNIYKADSLFLHTSGDYSLYLGQEAGNLTTTGSANTAVGASAMRKNVTGNINTAVGGSALRNNTTGSQNVAVGYLALLYSTEGGYNTACGTNSLENNQTGSWNTAVGWGALSHNTTGFGNSTCGWDALLGNKIGTYNTAIGYRADVSDSNLTNATAVGSYATVDASNKIRLGNTSVTVIEGQVAYTFTSDRNQKENFRPIDGADVLKRINGLDLTTWNYKNQDASRFRHYGPTAQDFYAAFGHDGFGVSGDSTSINSGDEVGVALAAIKELIKQNEELKDRLDAVTVELANLKAKK